MRFPIAASMAFCLLAAPVLSHADAMGARVSKEASDRFNDRNREGSSVTRGPYDSYTLNYNGISVTVSNKAEARREMEHLERSGVKFSEADKAKLR